MEKKKDEEKWTMPEDIVTTVTNKPEEMLYKYLVKPVKKTWTEDFRDECTGENISVERSELLFGAGDYINESLLQKIMFSIQAEEIENVEVSETKPMNTRENLHVKRYMVKITGATTSKNVYVTACKTPEDAAELVSDYHTIYTIDEIYGPFSITDSAVIGPRLIYPSEYGFGDWEDRYNISMAAIKSLVNNEDNIPPTPFQKPRYWKVNITAWWEEHPKWKSQSNTYMIEAVDNIDASNMVKEYCERNDHMTDRIFDVTSVGKAKIDVVIPQGYIEAWCEKKYGKDYLKKYWL